MTGLRHLGTSIAPPRFLLFLLLLAIAAAAGAATLGWRHGLMAGFDLAAFAFLLSCAPLLGMRAAGEMRAHAARNDANRVLLLAVTVAVTLVVLATVGAELGARAAPTRAVSTLVIVTLALAWLFSNSVYAMHYAHLYYLQADGGDRRGIVFPRTREPDYWDFVYFAFTLGMTFQTSDAAIEDGRIRRIATVHCLAAFVYNLGILAFTINVLGD